PSGLSCPKEANPSPHLSRTTAVAECALQLRRIGDKWDLRQKILNLLTKLFCPET
uniref:APR protein n=1 Tax=Bubo bubo TaxID=30461 RepID=A0A8C0EIQ9_BUBBB